jgi:hypothetical protein
MRPNTLAHVYAVRSGTAPAAVAPGTEASLGVRGGSPRAAASVAPASEQQHDGGTAPAPAAAPLAAERQGDGEPLAPAVHAAQGDERHLALLVAVRRSLESCRDTSQLRMLAAFEVQRRAKP